MFKKNKNGLIKDPYEYVKSKIVSIPNFPKEGIIFRDVTGILDDEYAFRLCNNLLLDNAIFNLESDFDVVAGIEARGFIFGSVLADQYHTRFVPVRKKGKLPRKTLSITYDLEYGSATMEIHMDSIKPGDKVLIIDDLLATGGTINAAANLIERLGGVVAGVLCIIDLPDLGGRKLLEDRGYKVETLCSFKGK